MARRIETTIVCDLPHAVETQSDKTVHFGFEGRDYELDACAAHAQEVGDALRPFADRARQKPRLPAPAERAHGGSVSRAGRSKVQRNNFEIRGWARDMGIPVAERGRIPADVIRRYSNRDKTAGGRSLGDASRRAGRRGGRVHATAGGRRGELAHR
jgi:hypothetical protein